MDFTFHSANLQPDRRHAALALKLKHRIATARRGVSLMEVLISTFVLSIGLLGLAALIPVGRNAIVETGKADRAGACGRAGMREVEVRRMLDASNWWPADQANPPLWWAAINPTDTAPKTVQYPPVNWHLPPGPNPNPPPAVIPFLLPFAIDPRGIAMGLKVNLGGPKSPSGGPPSSIARVTLRSPMNPALPMTLPEAESLFVWQDELLFDAPPAANTRPRRFARGNQGTDASPVPQTPVEANQKPMGTLVTFESGSDYSWLATVSPSLGEWSLPVFRKTQYSVSIAVCYKRNLALDTDLLTPLGEIVTPVKFLGPGYGGGSIELDDPVKIKANQWVLLCVPDLAPPQVPRQCKWYRVVSAPKEPGTASQLCKHLTLAGPDWTADSNNDGILDAQVVILDSVVGVYSTTIELDRDLIWNK